ncbi:MAG: acyltransferase family protein [Lachnospiraceae bacterium]|nr:acyltransferase family protein [Lachnospiraceae bacterium]
MKNIIITPKNNNGIDLCKFIMAFAVVAIHTQPLINCTNKYINEIFNLFVSMAVPFFFLSSGYLLAVKLQYPYQGKDDIDKIKKYLIRILKLYLLWMAIYFPIALGHYIISKTSIITSALSTIRGLIFVGEQYNAWPLWYLLSTVYALILIILLLQLKLTPKNILGVSLLISVISFGLDLIMGFDEPAQPILRLLFLLVKYSIGNGRILSGAIYIPAGMYLAHKKIPNPVNFLLLVGGFTLNFFTNNSFVSSYLLIVTSIGLFGIIQNIKLKDSSIYPQLRSMSTIIYLIHMYIFTFYYIIVYKQKTYGPDSFIITSFIACLISVIYIQIRKRVTK